MKVAQNDLAIKPMTLNSKNLHTWGKVAPINFMDGVSYADRL